MGRALERGMERALETLLRMLLRRIAGRTVFELHAWSPFVWHGIA